jgi:hypothetical protein
MPKPIYGFTEVSKSPILFVAEGQFDWLMLRQWGFPAVVLSGSHLPRYNIMLLREKMVIIVPDNDAVGQESAKKLHATLPNSYILDYTSLGVKDISELGADARYDGETQFRNLIKEQEWFKNIRLSKDHWMKWFPALETPTPLLSI